MFKRKKNKPEILGYYVRYSRETAKINPEMIQNDYFNKKAQVNNKIQEIKNEVIIKNFNINNSILDDIKGMRNKLNGVIEKLEKLYNDKKNIEKEYKQFKRKFL